MPKRIREKLLALLMTMAMVISLMPALTLSASAAYKGTTGTADGTYDFKDLHDADDSGSPGFKIQGDKFLVSNVFITDGNTIFANNDPLVNTGGASVNAVIKAQGGTVNKHFSFKDMNLSTPSGGDYTDTLNVFTIH